VERLIARLTVLRARLLLRMLIVAVAVLAAGDVVLRTDAALSLLAIKAGVVGGLLVGLRTLRRRPHRPWAVGICLAVIAACSAGTVASGWVAADPQAPPLTIGATLLLTAATLPWGIALQGAATVLGAVALGANAALGAALEPGVLASSPIGYTTVAALFSFALGLFVSYGLDRQRRRALESAQRRAAAAATLRALVHNAPDVVLIVDPQGTVLFSNRRSAPAVSIDPVGRTLFDFTSPSDHAAIRRLVAEVAEGSGPASFETAGRPSGAEEAPLYRCRMAALRRPGEPPAVIVTAADVTAERRAESERQESREVAAALTGVGRRLVSSISGPDLVDELRAAAALVVPGRRCEIVSLEPAWEENPAINAFADLLSGDAVELAREELRAFAAAVALPLDDGADVNALVVPMRLGDEVLGLLVVTRSESGQPFVGRDRRVLTGVAQLASLALRTSALVRELREANTVNSYFAATMSHEIRNMLASVVGYAQLVLEDSVQGDPLSSDGVGFLERIRDRGQEALGVIASALEVSRADDARRSVAGDEELDLRRLFAELADEMNDLRPNGGPLIAWTVADDLTGLRADRVKLRMVLKNLVSNSLKFTREGEIRLAARSEGDRALVSVSDTGVGIPAQQLPNLFKPFSQAHGRLSRDIGGTGLGLFIVRRLVEMLGGTIDVESAPGTGTKFTIALPLAAPARTSELRAADER
jgi:signal transduction histidine kinase/PAS domain-containing protein